MFCIVQLLRTAIQSVVTVCGCCAFIFATFVFLAYLYWLLFSKKRQAADGYQEQWFGKEPSPQTDNTAKENLEDTSIRPFKIDVSEDVLLDLKNRLDRTRFEDPVEGSKFHYGFNPNYLRKVVDYWKHEYDWRKHEKLLNEFPQFKTRIEGIDVHFLHVKPNLPENSQLKVIPLMILHGWPGSVVEFYKIIPLLTTPRPGTDFVFEVIAPSLPGFGFSESPHRKGLSARSMARIFVTMMERIGRRKFYVQGGDWGSIIGQLMGRYYPTRIVGLHINMYGCDLRMWERFKYYLIALFPFLFSKAEYKIPHPVKKYFTLLFLESGYFHMHATKPDTLGCSMADSPAGMAAYLLEKFGFATNPQNVNVDDGNLTEKFTLDELLTNVMVYWINNNFTASARFYKECTRDILRSQHEKVPVEVPSAVAAFPNEGIMVPKTCMSQQMKNLISYSTMPRGGHFAALEEPELLADDVWQFVNKVETSK